MVAGIGFFMCLFCLLVGAIPTKSNNVDALSMLNFVAASLCAFIVGVNVQ